MPLKLPKSRSEIRRIQAERKRFAVEQARRDGEAARSPSASLLRVLLAEGVTGATGCSNKEGRAPAESIEPLSRGRGQPPT